MLAALCVKSDMLDKILYTVADGDLSTDKIIEVYHLVLNVTAMVAAFTIQLSASDSIPKEHTRAERQIAEFNSNVHPKLLAWIVESTKECAENLKMKDSGHGREDMSDKYERLRQMMSTQEFLEQYDGGIR